MSVRESAKQWEYRDVNRQASKEISKNTQMDEQGLSVHIEPNPICPHTHKPFTPTQYANCDLRSLGRHRSFGCRFGHRVARRPSPRFGHKAGRRGGHGAVRRIGRRGPDLRHARRPRIRALSATRPESFCPCGTHAHFYWPCGPRAHNRSSLERRTNNSFLGLAGHKATRGPADREPAS